MEMSYDGALVMPSSYAVMDEEEMMYVEGGEESVCIDIVAGMLDQNYCLQIAKDYTEVTGMSQLRIAMEIYAHAVLFVGGVAAGSIVGLDNGIVSDIINRAKVINLGGDSVARLAAYTVIWSFGNKIVV